MSKVAGFTYFNSSASITRPAIGSFTDSYPSADFNGDSIFSGLKAIYCDNASGSDVLTYNGTASDFGTIEFWFKSKDWGQTAGVGWSGTNQPAGGIALLLDHGDATYYKGTFQLIPYNSGYIYIETKDGAGTVTQASTTTVGFAANTWHHYAIAWNKADGSGQVRFYFDGVEKIAYNPLGTGYTGITIVQRIGGFAGVTTFGPKGWFSGYKHLNIVKSDFKDRYDLRADLDDRALLI